MKGHPGRYPAEAPRARGECAHAVKEGDPLALRCVAALASSTTPSVARHRPTASSASTNGLAAYAIARLSGVAPCKGLATAPQVVKKDRAYWVIRRGIEW